MRKGKIRNSGKECDVYETFEEVKKIAFRPPRYCAQDAATLHYYSFYDSMGRFTLKACCPKCNNKWAISVKEEKYNARMLAKWTELVKERAGYACEMSDDKCAGSLHAHHIIPKHLDPAKQYDVENGICLCEAHHKMIHSYM